MAEQDHRIVLRRGTASEWNERNPTLKTGEPGYEIGTGRVKIGNGYSAWSDLPYFAGEPDDSGEETPVDLAAHVADPTPHPVYDDGPSLVLLYQNAKV